MFKSLNGRYPQPTASNSVGLISQQSPELRTRELATLGILAAIWGASFILMRLVVPDLGAVFTADMRIIIAALALLAFAYSTKVALDWRRNIMTYTLVGLLGAVLPFTLYCYAAQHLPAAMSALFNATSPLFGAVFTQIIWRSEPLKLHVLVGLLLGILGVALLLKGGALLDNCPTLLATLACLAAPACFALSAIIIKLHTCSASKLNRPDRIPPLAMATGSMVTAGVIVLPSLPFSLPTHAPALSTWALVTVLALIPSALAQILYLPLITKMGAMRAMSVAFLIPLFSLVWGVIFLHETIGICAALGGLTVLAALTLILRT